MKISNLCWRGCRSGLSKYPDEATARGVLSYLVQTYAVIDKDNQSKFPEETADLEFPDDGVQIPKDYPDLYIRCVLHELTHLGSGEVNITVEEAGDGEYKIARY